MGDTTGSTNAILNGGVLATSGTISRALGTGAGELALTSGGFAAYGGALTKMGTGTLVLSGANTYDGVTTVSVGTLQAGATITFSAASAVTISSGAILDLNSCNQTIGSLAGAGNATLGAATLIAGSDNTSTAFSGITSGTGGLTKTGTGALTFSGSSANTCTGTTTVNAGTLQLGKSTGNAIAGSHLRRRASLALWLAAGVGCAFENRIDGFMAGRTFQLAGRARRLPRKRNRRQENHLVCGFPCYDRYEGNSGEGLVPCRRYPRGRHRRPLFRRVPAAGSRHRRTKPSGDGRVTVVRQYGAAPFQNRQKGVFPRSDRALVARLCVPLTMHCLNPVCALAALALTAAVSAQTTSQTPPSPASAEAGPPVKLEAFTVTGSNIRRVDAETALPVTVFDQSDLDARGAATMAELFDTLGAAEPSGITEINNGPQLARGDVASIDLRGIGSGSTLTLLNGRRMAPHPISMAENGVPSLAVNINTLPRAMIERVEILRDGASAIYGADAAAGVINNYVSRTFVGRGITLKGSMTQHGGANEFNATIFDGFKRGKTHFSISLDYFHRDSLAARDRDWSKNADLRISRELPAPWNGIPVIDPATGAVFARDNDFTNTNNTNQWGQWQRGTLQPDFLTFVGARPTGNVGISTSTTPPAGVATMTADGMFYLWPGPAGVSFKQTTLSKNLDNPENATYSNGNNWKMLVPATDRIQFATFVDHQVNDRVDFFGDLLFYRAYSRTGREPVNFKNSDDPGIYLPAANPYNPFGVRFYNLTGAPNADGTPRLTGAPADVSLWTGISPGQNTGGGFKSRVTEVYSYSWRALGGLRGKLGKTWQWESALLASGAQTHEYEHFQVRESLLRRALARTDATAFNPFPVTFRIANNQIVVDQPFTNPDAVLDPLYDDEDRFGRTNLFMGDLKLTGQLPWRAFRGGLIGVATGAEVRYETYDDKRAEYVGLNPAGSGSEFPFLREGDNDFLALSSNLPIGDAQTIYAVYAEVALPFVTQENRLPLVHALELSLAGRFEHFSIHGQTTKPKASLGWKPMSWLRLRASIAESFRAPNLVQTNITALRRQISADDPYRFEVTGLPSDGTAQRAVHRQGNRNLKPEEAKTWVAGFVVDVPKIRGLSIAFDYFHLNQNKVIENIGAAAAIDRDEIILDLATQAELAKGTPIGQIDLGSGTANYKGLTKIVRKPVSASDRAAFDAYNARQGSNNSRRAAVGEIVNVIDDYLNLSGRDIQGYEFGVQYHAPRTRFGQITFKGDATHYVLRRSQADENSPVLNELGRNARTKWRASASLSWRKGPLSAGWFSSLFGSFVDTSAATTEPIYRALGQPDTIRVFNDNGITRYLLRVDPSISHNAWISYRFAGGTHRWLKGVTIRGGINNVFDTEPQLADEQYGYFPSTANARGRQFTLELAKRF